VEAYRAWTWRLLWRMPVPCWSHTRFGGDCEADYPGVGWDGPATKALGRTEALRPSMLAITE
jgi:hypothetical protein